MTNVSEQQLKELADDAFRLARQLYRVTRVNEVEELSVGAKQCIWILASLVRRMSPVGTSWEQIIDQYYRIEYTNPDSPVRLEEKKSVLRLIRASSPYQV